VDGRKVREHEQRPVKLLSNPSALAMWVPAEMREHFADVHARR
jgi:hypothetical protein